MTALVTIGIPTYNREALLRRALASALAQHYPALEVLVSDNCSNDGTEALCREVAVADPRVRYIRQKVNVGATANFNAVLSEARGEYFMWLSDDDVIAPDYVSECVVVLEAEPDVDLVGGKALLVSEDGRVEQDVSIDLGADRPSARVLGYYRRAGRNSLVFGVGRTTALRAQPPLANVIGGDWLLLAGMAYRGRIRTAETAALTRSLDGTSDDLRRAARSLQLGRLPRVLPRLAVALTIAGDILRAPTYGDIGLPQRARLAARCASSAGWRIGIRYHLVRLAGPAVRRIRAHRSNGSARSREEMVMSPATGHTTPSDGSSQRTPADASGA